LLVGGVIAQTPVATLPSPGSQINTLESCLIAFAQVQAPGATTSPFTFILGLFSPSSTFAYECDGSVSGAAPGSMSLIMTVEAAPNAPFIMAASIIPSAISCGGPTATPCLANATLLSSIPTPLGTYHLDAAPIIILDGFNPSGTVAPGIVGPFGQTQITPILNVDTAVNGGQEARYAVQILTADATAPAGATFSACLNIDQWVHYP
jgi:hypothetical protein